jgi:hypothetical protein
MRRTFHCQYFGEFVEVQFLSPGLICLMHCRSQITNADEIASNPSMCTVGCNAGVLENVRFFPRLSTEYQPATQCVQEAFPWRYTHCRSV